MPPSIVRALPKHIPKSSLYALRINRGCIFFRNTKCRGLATQEEAVPLRKHLKDEAKRRKAESKLGATGHRRQDLDQSLSKWELTVGIEVHAELNTACKLFSSAPAASADSTALPNSNVALFDAAMPGSQPSFQAATLLPALRAAIALGCEIQYKSAWDRKHYFHWDQPNGYQITQYYQPFAKNGHLDLTADDGLSDNDLGGAETLSIGIKQIQMEQDTAKTTSLGASTYHVDLNRAGHPLIEIITLPQIHSAHIAAAVVRKIQALLKSVDACVTGMELGGLRADVNVSIRERGTNGVGSSYSGVSGLGQRTEIKNLSSFAAVEKAIIAERGRQIRVLESGGVIEGETRGWTLGATETTRLRGKEGEVDYRYMPDPDLPPLLVDRDLVQHLKDTLPELPDETVARIREQYALSTKDAKTIVSLDDGERLEFMEETVHLLLQKLDGEVDKSKVGKTVGNWVLHELGGLLTASNIDWNAVNVTPDELSDIIANLSRKHITSRTAKQLLSTLHDTPPYDTRPDVEQLIDEGNLRLRPLTDEAYESLAREIMTENPEMVSAVRDKGQKGKIMWFIGQMVRRGEEGTIEPDKARIVIERMLDG